jgi:hypothetical protein
MALRAETGRFQPAPKRGQRSLFNALLTNHFGCRLPRCGLLFENSFAPFRLSLTRNSGEPDFLTDPFHRLLSQ